MFARRLRALFPARHGPSTPSHQAGAAPVGSLWPRARLALAQRLWGEGFLAPGGAAEILRLAAPMRLDAGTTCLLVGAGLPGPALALAESGAALETYESDPLLAQRAGARLWRPEAPDFGPPRCQRGLALEPLAGADPAPTIAALAGAILPVGQLVLTSLVATGGPGADTQDFAALHPGGGVLPTGAAVSAALRREGFALGAVRDLSETHIALVRAEWNAAIARLRAEGMRPDPVYAAEAAYWRARLRLLRAGALRLVCWHAVGKAETRRAVQRADPNALTPSEPAPS